MHYRRPCIADTSPGSTHQGGVVRALERAMEASEATTNPPAADRCPAKRSGHAVSRGHDGRGERPTRGRGQPRPTPDVTRPAHQQTPHSEEPHRQDANVQWQSVLVAGWVRGTQRVQRHEAVAATRCRRAAGGRGDAVHERPREPGGGDGDDRPGEEILHHTRPTAIGSPTSPTRCRPDRRARHRSTPAPSCRQTPPPATPTTRSRGR
jgi:hypothetical protein